MSWTLPNSPGPSSTIQELADFIEWQTWCAATTSGQELIQILGLGGDNLDNVGCEDDDDQNGELIEQVFLELDDRRRRCNNQYPFEIDLNGTLLKVTPPSQPFHWAYLYMLLATRFNMGTNSRHAKIDGALLFEEFCTMVLKNYLDPCRAKGLTFGTAVRGRFNVKVQNLAEHLPEIGGYLARDTSGKDKQDDNLDAVVWLPLADARYGQVVLFVQCKTGTSWSNSIRRCDSIDFGKKWFRNSLVAEAVSTYCVAESLGNNKWYSLSVNAGILFDRCRLTEQATSLDKALLERIKSWTNAARTSITKHATSTTYSNTNSSRKRNNRNG